MKEFDLINHSQFEYELTCLNNEFEQFQIKEFDRDSCLIPITNWIEKFLIFIREIQDGYTFIQRNNELERFIDAVAEKYPYYKNPNVFDPKSNFTNSQLQIWENALVYLSEFNKQNTKLMDIGEELLFDFYLNKIKEFDPISKELYNSLRLKKQKNRNSVITEDVLDQFSQFGENTISKIPLNDNPYPHIFVNVNAFNLFSELCTGLKNNRPKKQLIKEDLSFIIDILKMNYNKIGAIKLDVNNHVLCEFFREYHLTKNVKYETKDIKLNRQRNKQNRVFEDIIIKYKTPFIN